jgi:hypothetical protein
MIRATLIALLVSLPAIAQNREGGLQTSRQRPARPASVDLDLDLLAGVVKAPQLRQELPRRILRCLVTAYTDHDPADIAAGYG